MPTLTIMFSAQVLSEDNTLWIAYPAKCQDPKMHNQFSFIFGYNQWIPKKYSDNCHMKFF